MAFVLLIVAVQQSPTSTMRALYHSIDSAFDLEALKKLPNREAFFKHGLGNISTRSKDFFPLSSKYFETESGAVELLRQAESFVEPQITAALNLPIQLPEFAFSAWVQATVQFRRGYLVRKRLAAAGPGSELACFGWHVDGRQGPALHFGAQDFYPQPLDPADTGRQEQIQLEGGQGSDLGMVAGEWQLLTMVITTDADQQAVTFFRDLDRLGSVVLPRPITDCFNDMDGLVVGSAGVRMAQLRFYPHRLSLSTIKEIHQGGTVLADVSTGSQPDTQVTTPLQAVGRGLGESFEGLSAMVSAQQPRSEVDLVLQTVDQQWREELLSGLSPPAPFGQLAVENSTRVDPVTGRAYTLLLEGPYRLTQPPAGEERYFDPATFPRWGGQGMSVSLWLRRARGCEDEACGTYILSAHPEGQTSSIRCYSAWIEKRGVYFDNARSAATFVYKLDIMAARYQLTPNHWRHLTFVWDPQDDMWRYYQDGSLALEVPFGSSVREADCASPSTRVTLGARFPGWTYGVEDEYYDMRMWVGAVLSPAHVRALASAPTPQLTLLQFPREEAKGESLSEWERRVEPVGHAVRCMPDQADTMQDNAWTDLYGHTCEWYFNNVGLFPGLCELREAALNCPIACKALQPCLETGLTQAKAYLAWKSIRRLEPQGPKGSLCLHSQLSTAQVRAECVAWHNSTSPLQKEAEAEGWEVDMNERAEGGARSRRVNLTDCDEVAATVDTGCAFDYQAVRDFTRDLKANGGDFSVGFWIKPLGEQSLHADGTFYPSVSFVSRISPPAINLAFARFGTGTYGEVRIRTACPPAGEDGRLGSQLGRAENVELAPLSQEDWTFVAFARTNSSGSKGLAATDLGGFREDAGEWAQCLFDQDLLFSAIEVNYAALVSPIMLVPTALPLAKMQELYYREVNHIKLRRGPLEPNSQRKATVIDVRKRDLEPRSVLMATPLIFATRVMPTAACPYDYSRRLVQEQHMKVQASKCAFPFRCEPHVLASPEATISCAGPLHESTPFFGLGPRSVNGRIGFADLLYSITDNEFLFRDGALRETRDFVDSLTQQVSVLLVFFTPQYGVTSVLDVTADVSGPSVTVKTSLVHYHILEGWVLQGYIAVLCSVVAVASVMLGDVILQLKAMWARRREDGSEAMTAEEKQTVGKCLLDGVNVAMILVFVILQLRAQIASAGDTERVLGAMAGIEWESSVTSVEEKKDVFFKSVLELLRVIQVNSDLDSFLNGILLVSLLRIMQYTSIHPRLALLTGTLKRAADDLWHTAVLIVVVMFSFAGIATWRFGKEHDDFGSIEASMQTEFRLMFGEFLRYWGQSREMQAFVVLYYMVMFLLMLNFLLAIVVESYMKVRRYNEEIEYENEFFHDLSASIGSVIYGRLRGWPPQYQVAHEVDKLRGKLSIGYSELARTGLFRRQQDITDFLSFYSRLDCLQPPLINSISGFDEADGAERRIVRQVGDMLGLKVRTLKERAREAEQRLACAKSFPSSPLQSRSPVPAMADKGSLRPLSTQAQGSFGALYRSTGDGGETMRPEGEGGGGFKGQGERLRAVSADLNAALSRVNELAMELAVAGDGSSFSQHVDQQLAAVLGSLRRALPPSSAPLPPHPLSPVLQIGQPRPDFTVRAPAPRPAPSSLENHEERYRSGNGGTRDQWAGSGAGQPEASGEGVEMGLAAPLARTRDHAGSGSARWQDGARDEGGEEEEEQEIVCIGNVTAEEFLQAREEDVKTDMSRRGGKGREKRREKAHQSRKDRR